MFVEPFVDIKDLHRLQEALKKDGKLREMLITQVLFETNLRVSDVLKMRWSDFLIDDTQTVKIYKLKEQKTRKAKTFPVTDSLSFALLACYAALGSPDRKQFIFLSASPKVKRWKRAWSREYVTSFLKAYAKKIGVTQNIGAHSLRKTWAYHSYKNGTQLYMISKIMNHSSPQVTERYAGITQERMNDEYQKVSRLHDSSDLFKGIRR